MRAHRAAVALLAAVIATASVGGCGQSYGPKDIQLSITAEATIGDAELATIKTLDVAVSGVYNQVQTVTLDHPMGRVEKIAIHLPAAHGDVVSSVLARDAASLIVARGSTAAVHLDVGSSHTAAATLAPMPNNQHVASAIALTPAAFTLFTGQTAQLGADGEMLAWSSSDGGSITADGLFTAAGPGTFHAVGKSLLFPTDSGTVTLTVLTSGVARFAGDLGGAGTVDGTGALARLNNPAGLVPDGKGGYFFSDGGHTIRRFDVGTGDVVTLAGKPDIALSADGKGAGAGFVGPDGIVFDGNDTIYVAESASQIIRAIKVSTGEATILAGVRNMQGTNDGTGGGAQFRWPRGLAFDPVRKLLYVGEDLAHTIRTVDPMGKVTTVAGTVNMGAYKDGPIAQAQFNNPSALLFDPASNALYIFDAGNRKVRKWDFGSNSVSTLVDGQDSRGMALDKQGYLLLGNPLRTVDVGTGAATLIRDAQRQEIYEWVNSISVAGDGSYLIGSSEKILRFDAAVAKLVNLAGYDFQWGETVGPRSQARMSGLSTLTVGPDGTVYARDNRLLRIDAAGNVTNIIGDDSGPIVDWDGGMTVGSDGAVYAVDRSKHTVVRIDLGSGTATDFAGARNQSGSTDGPLASARFRNPEDITADGNKLYVADGNNHTIRVIDLGSKMVSTLAGMAGVCGYADMPGTAAQFCAPHGVVADGKGNLYVSHNNSIRKIVIAGAVVSTVAGAPGTFGYKDETGAAAQFWGPNRLALDKAGKYLYLTEYGVDTVRRIELSSTIVSTVAGAPGRSQVVEGPLPGGVNQGAGIAVLPNGDLLVAVPRENSIVQIRLP